MAQTLCTQTTLLLMPLEKEQHVVECRTRARRLAAHCGFNHQCQVRIATAVSEIARNAFRYARGGTAEFALGSPPEGRGPQQFLCVIKDKGSGIRELAEILAGRHISTTGLGSGILGARKLMDTMDIQTGEGGTSVTMGVDVPAGKKWGADHFESVLDEIQTSSPVNPLDEISMQNQELIRTLGELREQQQELQITNAELRETNRGVVALYDELDTVSRVGKVVASKLDRDRLLQGITAATTEICAADVGIFFYHAPEDNGEIHHHIGGAPGVELLEARVDFEALSMLVSGTTEPTRVDDLASAGCPVVPIALSFAPRSYLHVPVRDADDKFLGGLVFLHHASHAFSERSERILATVATQAAIGLENARLYENMRRASAAKDHFISILSHELRTPLNPVFAVLTDMEEAADLPAGYTENLAIMRRNLELEARLIDDLLDLTRISRNEFPLRVSDVDLHEVLRGAYQTCAASAAARGIEVTWELRATSCHVRGDSARLQQAFWNLIGNAVKFSRPGTRVVVKTDSGEDGFIEVAIQDQGRGIRPEVIQRIFHPFEQGDAAVGPAFGGLGLGLAISQGIITRHGGEITAESAGVDLGSTFRVRLRTIPTPVPTAAAPARAGPSISGGLRILLVDDHQDSRSSLSRLLARRGHDVTIAATAQEALNLARRGRFDVLLSDLGLPDFSGHELMRLVRAEYPALPGIALSGYGMEGDREKSRQVGFSTHLVKPVDVSALDAALASIQR